MHNGYYLIIKANIKNITVAYEIFQAIQKSIT